LDYAERFSKRTYDEKRTLVRRVLALIEPDTPVFKIKSETILSYLNSRAKNQSNNAYNKDRKNLLAMWNWGQDYLDITTNPVAKIKKLPHNRSPQYTPPTEDVLRLLAVATRQEQVFLDCYLNTAARRSEIFRWTWADDINFEKRQVRLGSRKTRDGSMEYVWLPMNTDLYESLWWWWNNRRFKNSPYVFVNDRRGPHYGQPYKYRNHFMGSLCKRAGIKPFGFHALRRYVASVLADTHKVSAKRIQRILRHKSLSTTERYIQNINEDLEDTLELLSTMPVPPNGTPKRKKDQVANT
jgi:integrase